MSITGQVQEFVEKLSIPSHEIEKSSDLISIDRDYIIVIPTYDHKTTALINEFIQHESNLSYCRGVVGSGNLAFGEDFTYTAKDISKQYNIPLLRQIEYSGSDYDVEQLEKELKFIGIT